MTKTDPETPDRRSIRLQGWDYSGEGWYFVTVVAFRRECLFGMIQKGEMTVNAVGRIIQECWQEIPAHFPNVTLDAFVVMPNHVHGIVVIDDEEDLPAEAVPVGAEADVVPVGSCRGDACVAPTGTGAPPRPGAVASSWCCTRIAGRHYRILQIVRIPPGWEGMEFCQPLAEELL